MHHNLSRALGIAVGVLADRLFGDPHRHHPVAWFGTWASRVEKPLYADDRAHGAGFVVAAVAPVALVAMVVERSTRTHPVAHAAATAVTTWAVLGARSLAHEGEQMADRLDEADLEGARAQLGHLCGRDPAGLDESELARAVVESMAENTADAVVASLFWGAVSGIPGLVVHRCLNTLDAMFGHRNDRYGRFGTAAARLDDAADWLPARITGAAACMLAPVVDGDPAQAWRIMRRDAHDHPSPNGGWCEAAWAGALGVQLGGRNTYQDRVEERGLLGDGPRPTARELRKAATLVTAVTCAVTAAAVTVLTVVPRRGR
ncbi:cobalamin biosynthesis protein [Tessaracoccus defluvii]|uniref:Cobalamin biosynthesis protein CobD n=1 Tax=Tessaracoccus defluvii TaxID=1285901 RepID=A0A7H0H772_9ACTN|nr:cobalamin biosynthesis protein [Tessaracoccus defluvii]QNP56388.1 cobalamin biosynthesis protein [Tessaracoccus defluvii]